MSKYYRVKTLMLKGQKGDGIKEIKKTSTSGLVDTYTITLTDGTKKSFTVSNGKGIKSIAKTSTSGLVDTYTTTYNDGTTSTFTVTNGEGVNKWVTLYDKTFTEDTDKVVIEDAYYDEVEAYVFIKTKTNTNDNLYLSSNGKGSIYVEPRVSGQVNGSWIGIRMFRLKKITNFLWETGSQVSNYFIAPVPLISPNRGYSSIVDNKEFNYDKTNGISLAYQNGTKFQTGDRVFIRAR